MSFILLGILNSQAAAGGFQTPLAGYAAALDATSTIDKFAFPSDTRTTLATGLSSARGTPGSFGNHRVAGYVAGGGSAETTVDKFSQPGDTRTTLATGLSVGRGNMPSSCFSNQTVAGYVPGGNASGTVQSVVDKFDYSNDARSTLATGLSQSNRYIQGLGNFGIAGYASGGVNSPDDVVDKFSFPTDSRTTITSLPFGTHGAASFSNEGVAGYIAGGDQDGVQSVTRIFKITYSSDTYNTLAATLSGGRELLGGMGNSGTAGYTTGGFDFGASAKRNTVDKLVFSTESNSALATGLSVAGANSAFAV